MQYIRPKKTLVIGGTGFVGSHLAPHLQRSGRIVTIFSRFESIKRKDFEGLKIIKGDVRDVLCLNKIIDDYDEVVHLAYSGVPNTSQKTALGDLTNNLSPVIHLMQLCAERGIKLILISSGGAVYGQSQCVPISESHPLYPISPYGVIKLAMESYARIYRTINNLDYICIRPSNPYGEGQRPYLGQGFIATAIASIFDNKPIQVFGAAGTIRDYIYIDDLCAGIVAAMDCGRSGNTYNIGTGIGRSNLQVLDSMRPLFQSINIKISIEFLPPRVFDVEKNILDSTALKEISGWMPQTLFEDGIHRTINFLGKSPGKVNNYQDKP
jgi:UDP-glucose 4-epimerase